ncbi:DUF4158 domain-containing protein [Nonomuraea angiospora]|uniref:DUF4158 domain-containing protein n=1 Tax=Nonomuraea angiospora TaxID=46172 RepID=UPI003EB96B11
MRTLATPDPGAPNGKPTRPELERFFFLDDEDRKLIAKRHGDHNRLGFALKIWTTRYIDAAVVQLRAEGHEIRDEDVARLSSLKHKNLNVLGRYSFTPTQPAGGTLRPLRDPDAAGLDDDEDGAEN